MVCILPERRLPYMRKLSSVRTIFLIATACCFTFSCSQKPTSSNSEAAPTGSTPVDYSPRIGIGVRTGTRTCIAVKNGTLSADLPVTLITPVIPQTFAEARISGQSSSSCPIAQNPVSGVVSYDISVPDSANLTKLAPFIAVLGTAASSNISVANNGVVADLDHTQTRNTFRACGANDGVHLTVWRNDPLTGTLLWSASYFESGNPGTLPTCAPAELAPSPAPR